jgi:hypothetical protein
MAVVNSNGTDDVNQLVADVDPVVAGERGGLLEEKVPDRFVVVQHLREHPLGFPARRSTEGKYLRISVLCDLH